MKKNLSLLILSLIPSLLLAEGSFSQLEKEFDGNKNLITISSIGTNSKCNVGDIRYSLTKESGKASVFEASPVNPSKKTPKYCLTEIDFYAFVKSSMTTELEKIRKALEDFSARCGCDFDAMEITDRPITKLTKAALQKTKDLALNGKLTNEMNKKHKDDIDVIKMQKKVSEDLTNNNCELFNSIPEIRRFCDLIKDTQALNTLSQFIYAAKPDLID
jgi:hypothetical protein